MQKEYEIDGIKFVQKEIVAEQYSRIMGLLGDISDFQQSVNGFINLLGKNIVDFLDIILECDNSVKKRDFIAKHFKISDIKEVVSDFFSFNDLFSIIMQMAEIKGLTKE